MKHSSTLLALLITASPLYGQRNLVAVADSIFTSVSRGDNAALQRGAAGDAVDESQQALALRPRSAKAHLTLGRALLATLTVFVFQTSLPETAPPGKAVPVTLVTLRLPDASKSKSRKLNAQPPVT